MKPKVYIETSFLSFLTARPTRDVVMSAMIKQSKEWWENERDNFDVFVSDLVGLEALAGDPDAARRRENVFKTIPALVADSPARSLSEGVWRQLMLRQEFRNPKAHEHTVQANSRSRQLPSEGTAVGGYVCRRLYCRWRE